MNDDSQLPPEVMQRVDGERGEPGMKRHARGWSDCARLIIAAVEDMGEKARAHDLQPELKAGQNRNYVDGWNACLDLALESFSRRGSKVLAQDLKSILEVSAPRLPFGRRASK